VVRYLGRRAFLELVTSPAYLQVKPYKLSSLEVVLTPLSGKLMISDARSIAGAAGLASLFLVGWIRAARRSKTVLTRPKASAAGLAVSVLAVRFQS
jgi:hypothetical protein